MHFLSKMITPVRASNLKSDKVAQKGEVLQEPHHIDATKLMPHWEIVQ